ncbi:Amt family ammonium transporter [Bradyrhizobium sp. USDA 4524]|uniref:ammonium transporter n=1 Tax=unclassified Bradyrhizobium TaxID=2631580 RepID=UPI0020A05D60|nr:MULTISPECIES: ammonium transporter [unclassified Bradyrhizobium]MCP1845680.1 Amt family ammonium transporter [Bradyrhizobium sp. USDA 4538]MCP1906996.1 Amt family ammonium transporter [Bradyrhizobium sp. USDA 4537]MCP1985472.1 Amt family ammonium transporter [Bradyrhizobium sp. USDA 4539]
MLKKMRDVVLTTGVFLMAGFGEGLAQTATPAATTPAPALNSGDAAWMLTSSLLVLMMLVPGLALFYGGLVRKKNVLAVLMQCFFAAGILSVIWIVIGYTLAFTEGNPFFGGMSKFMLQGIAPDTLAPAAQTIPEFVFVMFQLTFAIITPVIILGGPADRMKFSAAMLFLSLWLLLVYAPIAHMVWGPGGFLADAGVLDFAGGTVVHINSGIAGLIAALMIGKRQEFGTDALVPHNVLLTMIGGALLWVGWFGFNAGSALSAGGSAGIAMINTHGATAAAIVSWCLVEAIMRGKSSLLGAVSGAIAGLVAITPACGFVSVSGALIIGLAAGVTCYWGVSGLKNMFGYDDALDVWGVHGVGGILGAILTGVFAIAAIGGTGKAGLVDGNPGQILLQLEGVGMTLVWSGVISFVLLKLIDITIGLRVSKENEEIGLDLALHGEAIHS